MDRQKRAAGRGDRAGIALGVVLGAAVTWNLAANLWLPWALYVPVPLSARLQVQITGPGSLPIPEPQEGLMAEEPTAPTPLDAIDLQSLSDEELQRLIQLLMRERERRMGLEPGPEDPE